MIKNIFTKTRWLVTIILLLSLGIGNAWGGSPASTTMQSVVTANSYTVSEGNTIGDVCLSIDLDDNITVSINSGGNNGTFWGTGAAINWRGYQAQDGTYTIEAKNGCTLSSVTFTFSTDKGGTLNTSGTGNNIGSSYRLASGTALSVSGTSKTLYVGNTNSTGSNLGKGQVRITAISVSYSAGVSCSTNPTTGNASINGSFTLTSLTDAVSVSSGTWGPGSNCAWIDYGFVWGTSSSPTVDNNKVQIGTSGNGTSWTTDGSNTAKQVKPSGSTSPTAWVVGTPYYVKAYGKNGKTGATFYYSTTAASFTLRSITYNSNGGSTVNTQYVNSGGTYSAPSAPTKDGYTFSNWCTNSTLTADMDWTAAISENKSLYAKWTANPYTISLDNQSATTPGDASISVTYDSNTNLTGTPAITVPKKTGYTFGGYYTSTGGSGDQIIDADGNVVASVSGYTSATKQWIYAGDKTLYAKWTIKNYTITWKVNGETWTPKTTTGEGTDGSGNANYNTAWSTLTLPTDPGASELTSCVADKFMGWTESENYESDSAPTDLLNSSNKASKTSKKITKNTTFYAVFADYEE